GDETYGNYNRVLLSNVLARSQDPGDIFINPLDWYRENGVTLHAGVRIRGIERRGRRVFRDDGVEDRYDVLVIATGSRAFVPPFEGLAGEGGGLKDGMFVFRTIDDCHAIIERAATA